MADKSGLFSHALLVEDESAFARVLTRALQELKIPVQRAASLAEAKSLLKKTSVDLLLLDRGLPDGDGVELLRLLKEPRPATLILSARAELADRIEGLDAGADDYLPKPFRFEELEARLRALARRFKSQSGQFSMPTSEFDDPALWTMDWERSRAFGPKGWQDLTPLELKFLDVLVRQANKIVSRKQLLTEVWGVSLLTRTRSVDQFWVRLRKYFEPHPEEPRFFLTYRGQGYLLKIQPQSLTEQKSRSD